MISSMEWKYPLAGLIVLIGSVAFLKYFDFLAAQSVKRFLGIAGVRKADRINDSVCQRMNPSNN
jgi:hypothetical protein